MKEQKYTLEEMKQAFETGRNFQLTGENNFNELVETLIKPTPPTGSEEEIIEKIALKEYPEEMDWDCGVKEDVNIRPRIAYIDGIKKGIELSKQPSGTEAIEFAEFIVREFWIVSSNDLWYQKSDGNPDEGLTTEELYHLFTIQRGEGFLLNLQTT